MSSLVIDPSTPETLYAGKWSGVFTSTDGGRTWQPFGEGMAPKDVHTLAIDPTSGRLYAGTYGGGVFVISR